MPQGTLHLQIRFALMRTNTVYVWSVMWYASLNRPDREHISILQLAVEITISMTFDKTRRRFSLQITMLPFSMTKLWRSKLVPKPNIASVQPTQILWSLIRVMCAWQQQRSCYQTDYVQDARTFLPQLSKLANSGLRILIWVRMMYCHYNDDLTVFSQAGDTDVE